MKIIAVFSILIFTVLEQSKSSKASQKINNLVKEIQKYEKEIKH